MVLAEAAVPGALAAIAELQVGIVRVRAAADGALVVIAPLLLLLADGLFEVHRLGVMAIFLLPDKGVNSGPDEHQEVQQRHHRQNGAQPAAGQQGLDDADDEHRNIQPGQPLDLHRDEEEQQQPGVREQEGEGQEHGQVHILRAAHGIARAGDGGGHDGDDGRQQDAAPVIEVEAGGAPLALQGGADPVVEVQTDGQPEGTAAGGDEDEGDDAPYLAPKDLAAVQIQESQGVGVGAHGQQHQNVHRHVADDDPAHQVRDAKAGVPGAEAVHRVIDLFQGEIPPIRFKWVYCNPLQGKSHYLFLNISPPCRFVKHIGQRTH